MAGKVGAHQSIDAGDTKQTPIVFTLDAAVRFVNDANACLQEMDEHPSTI